jgi:hypothetical protein
MIFDDHDVSDDWNISSAWVEEMHQQPYWNDQIVGGYASYWIYQHLGNLSPEELDRDELYNSVRNADDAWPVLRDFAYRAHRGPDGTRWSYHRDFGDTRLLMMDARGGRVLKEDRRSIVDTDEWAWIEDRAARGFDHLLLGTSLPLLLGPAMNHIQSHAWSKPATLAARLLARLAGAPNEPLAWRLTNDATFFDNQVATLEFEDRRHHYFREGRPRRRQETRPPEALPIPPDLESVAA